MTEEKKPRWPDLTRRIASDDLEIEVEGQKYYPHAGEWVLMTRKVSPAALQTILRFTALSNLDEPSAETATQYGELLRESVNFLSDAVLDWSWTGPEGEAYPKPHGQPDVIAHLMNEEFTWLIGKYQSGGEVPKN